MGGDLPAGDLSTALVHSSLLLTHTAKPSNLSSPHALQSTGFEFMTPPWLQYEAYDIKVGWRRWLPVAALANAMARHTRVLLLPAHLASMPLFLPHPHPQFINNIIHDIEGAGFGVWGCYDCMLAYNTLVRVGSRSQVIEIVFGERSCDGEQEA